MSPPPSGRSPLRHLPLALILVTFVAGIFLLRDELSPDVLARYRETLEAYRDAHYAWAVLGFLAIYVAIVAFSLPGSTLATLTGGFLFGIFPGAAYNVLAASIGAVCVFLAARAGIGGDVARKIEARGGAAARLQAQLRENEIPVLLMMRLVPAVPFFIANLIPAFVGTRTSVFAFTTALGIIPGAVVFTSVGAGLGAVFDRGEAPDLSIIFTPAVLGPILGLAALSALPIIVKALRKGKTGGGSI